jgi:ATP-dependent protease ClpP protease subunit
MSTSTRCRRGVSNFITEHCTITKEKLNELLYRTGELANDVGTVLIGQDAVTKGLIREVGGLREAMARLKELIRLKKEDPHDTSYNN